MPPKKWDTEFKFFAKNIQKESIRMLCFLKKRADLPPLQKNSRDHLPHCKHFKHRVCFY